MKSTAKRACALYILVGLFFVGAVTLFIMLCVNSSKWAMQRTNEHIYTNGTLVTAGAVLDRNSKVLVETKNGERIYNQSSAIRKATLHILGDTSGFISTGVQNVYSDELVGYSFLNGVYLLEKYQGGNNVKLTIDADVCATALNVLGSNKGAVCAYNYKTGEIICMVSAPTYDPQSVPKDIMTNTEKYEGVYLNRVFSGVFTPGSTFKIVTAISAIENISNINQQKFNCNGKTTIGDGTVICNGTHGELSFKDALAHSCNCAFSEIAVQLGNEKLQTTANQLGFNKALKMNKTVVAKSTFNVSSASTLDLGWAGIGQYTTLVNPYHMMTILGAIANGGTYVKPYLVDGIETQLGIDIPTIKTKDGDNYMSENTANTIKDMLRYNVTSYYGDSKFPNLQMCGKTGTAELDNEKSHAWFVGFSENENCPYAIVVCVQNGGSGYDVAIPVANKVMQSIYKSVSKE
ncbi:MAG: penicillin-binding protein [Clostridiales bacterium]|nr:penicillin-binding protein [Clostridiales bacterium]